MSTLVGTPSQVAEALETSEDSVIYLKERCGLPFVMVNRKQWRVPWRALDEWLASQAGQNAMATIGTRTAAS